MTTKQGDVALLNDPVAQKLLQLPIPARLAYVWSDGTPRVIPIGFHWDGHDLVFATPPNAPKSNVLKDGSKVAVTIDTNEMPYKVLLIRGTAKVSLVDGIVPEYVLMTKRCFGEEAGEAWLANVRQMMTHPKMRQMMRIAVTPEWVGIIDFEQRFPSAIEKAMAGMAQSG
jgi:hypothetical protein